ncbi:MAG: tRNA lysidine(34) synthetase TilS [Clostridia bacterium]|nr:tRNA lysidine(34) synthetase TilS [Clostridia bacterium]
MLKKVTEAVTRFGLLKDVKHITVALSGGADSMALLDALLQLKDELGVESISATHFNHQIRGEEALRDQSFVLEQCKSRGIECLIGEADVPEFARQNHLSLELAARELRYKFFESLDTDAIATAHTASDNIETVIFNITRGTALSGLCGIPPKRENYIRPLILCTRDDVENYCAQNGIEFVTDSTNLSDEYTRNKIRHNVVPVLKSFNESAENAVSRMTASLREDEDFINNIVLKEYNALQSGGMLLLDGFKNLHTAVAKRIIVKYCADIGVETDNFHINQIYGICLQGGKISLSGDKTAEVQNGVLAITSAKKEPTNVKFTVEIKESDNDLFENCEKVHNLLLKNILDCDKIVGKLVLRNRVAGDAIRLKNKNCTKTLKKLFCEYKIPADERDMWPVLCDDDGIVWIHKIGVADRCAADKNSLKIYKISVEKSFLGDISDGEGC